MQPLGEYEDGQRGPRRGPDATPPPASGASGESDVPILDGAIDSSEVLDAGNISSTPMTGKLGPALAGIPPGDPPDASPPPITRCAPTLSLPAVRKRLDMYIVMDANVSLPYTGQWELVTAGLRAFVRDSRTQGVGVGLRFYGNQCDADVYSAQPDVEVDLVAKTQDKIVDQTAMRLNYTASPMGPALQGGIQHQTRRAADHPTWKQVVVIVTDGVTQDFTCPYTTRDLENEAASGFAQTPTIETHVVGFGLPDTGTIADNILARFLPLDSIAAAGGSRTAVTVKSNDEVAKVNEAFQTVRRKAQPCEFLVPSDLDPAEINLTLTPGGDLPRVDDATQCGQWRGFYYDDPAAPTSMVLCPASCYAMQQNDAQTAVLLAGCPSRRR